ncbi:MAG TPA: energy transducer TonB [Syntrophorhabdaceae bacterium]|nr:energy transducer TonB [Syntrophorhabdaceae bacterium]
MHWQKCLLLSIAAHIVLIVTLLFVPHKRPEIIETIAVDFTMMEGDFGVKNKLGGRTAGRQKGGMGDQVRGNNNIYNHNITQKQEDQHDRLNIEDTHNMNELISLNPVKADKTFEKAEIEQTSIRGTMAGNGSFGSGYGTGRPGGGSGGSGYGPGGGTGSGGVINLADYTYVRDAVMKNISYPEKARRMGMEGRVIISFVINEAGLVNDVKILKSSGYALLDDAVMDALSKVNRFRKKPERLLVQLPIEFRLR